MIFLLVDNPLSDNQLSLLGDLLSVTQVQESDELLENLPQSDLYIINLSRLRLIHFYEVNKSEAKEIIYYKTRNIFRDDAKIAESYYKLTNFPTEAKTKEELLKKILVDNQLERVSKCGSCCEFIANRITCSRLCKYLCSCISLSS